MLTLVLLGLVVAGPNVPVSSRATAASPIVSKADGLASAASLSGAILRSLTPAQLDTLRARGSLPLRRAQVSAAQRDLLSRLALALHPGSTAPDLPALAVRLTNRGDGAPAIALVARGDRNVPLAEMALPVIACHW